MKMPTIDPTYVRSAERPWLGPSSIGVVAATFDEALRKTRTLLRREWKARQFTLDDTLEMRMPYPDLGSCYIGSIRTLIA